MTGIKQSALWKKIKKNVKKTFLYGTIGVLLGHGILQMNNMVMKYQNLAYPSKERVAFRKTFRFPIEGWEEDIEKSQYTLPVISAVLHKERIECPLTLSSLYIRSESYFKKTFFDQMKYLLRDRAVGVYNPIADHILLDAGNFKPLTDVDSSPKHTYNTIIARLNTHHEIKHDKTADLLLVKEPILEVWALLAKDAEGKSLYLGNNAVGQTSDLRKEDEYYGFVSTYARKNVEEDIAETCARAECVEDALFTNQFIKWLYDKPHPIISRKVRLAQHYGLIPQEFTEYVGLLKQYRDLQQNDISDLLANTLDTLLDRLLAPEKTNPQNPVKFWDDSALFLKKHPRSVYTISLRQKRGDVLYQHANLRNSRDILLKAKEEYKKGLAAQYKEPHTYQDILEKLVACSDALGEKSQAENYRNALKEYERRAYAVKDPMVALQGVDDVLREQK